MLDLLDSFVVRSVIAGLIMVCIAAPIGCLMIWQRLAFLSDTLGHTAVLGVGLGLWLKFHPLLGVLIIVVLIVTSLSRVTHFNTVLSETRLAIISQSGLAAGLILLSSRPNRNINIESILFGDLLTTSRTDLLIISTTAIILLCFILRYWRSFVAISVSREIAQAEGIEVRKMQFLMYLMIALLVAVMMQVMGLLLVASVLLIPTSSARLISQSPEKMVILSLLFGAISLAGGLLSSFHFDWQTGPAIVLSAAFLLILCFLSKQILRQLAFRD